MADDAEGGKDGEAFDALVSAMPRIAEAVKAFPEAVQGKAFDALMASLSGDAPTTATGGAGTGTTRKRRKPSTRKAKATADGGKTTTRRRSAGPVTTVKGLDLTPKGKKSFKDFATEKAPSTQHDRNAVSVYYLAHVAEVPAVTVNHVYTCYRDMGWRSPADMSNSLVVTASRKRFLNTADLQDVKLTPQGLNRIEHELPKKTKA